MFNAATATIEHVHLENNAVGLSIGGRVEATIRDSVVSGNTGAGLQAQRDVGQLTPELTVGNCMITNNNDGIRADDAEILISNSTITYSVIGIEGTVFSRTNNIIEKNTTNVSGTLLQYSAK